MLDLDESLLIGQGNQRKCYQHPTDLSKCIKISNPAKQKSQQLEYIYYKKLQRRNICWDMLAQSYGHCQTNFGQGYIFEFIRDFDGGISQPISSYLYSETESIIRQEDLFEALLLLKVYIFQQKITVRNLRPYNFVYKRLNQHSGQAVIIDNIGHHNNLLHLSDYIPALALRDIKKKWNQFENSFMKTNSH